MVQLHTLQPRTPRIKTQRIGRGGKRGKTSGKGTKGQLARSGRKLRPELRDIIKKLPKRRGRGKSAFTSTVDKPQVVNLVMLDHAFEAGATISPETLLQKGLIRRIGGKFPKVKILAKGTLSKKFKFEKVLFSEGAKAAVDKQ